MAEEMYRCLLCGEKFGTKRGLIIHKSKKHSTESQRRLNRLKNKPKKNRKEIEEILNDLRAQKEDIKKLLYHIEDGYRRAQISEETYEEIKRRNEQRLLEIYSEIDELEKVINSGDL
ncbi:MAG: hypothetical protein DRP11_01075 [Candidatus Aenigmatarchaeota archaeon]|nr:MAG: hypothetical protein DRP11_01075 [Candidatus Aenigmarchaeota archaeon]